MGIFVSLVKITHMIKNNTYSLLLLLLFLSATGCISIREDIYLQKDGSGKFQLSLNMGKLVGNPFIASMLEEKMKSKDGQTDSPFNFEEILGDEEIMIQDIEGEEEDLGTIPTTPPPAYQKTHDMPDSSITIQSESFEILGEGEMDSLDYSYSAKVESKPSNEMITKVLKEGLSKMRMNASIYLSMLPKDSMPVGLTESPFFEQTYITFSSDMREQLMEEEKDFTIGLGFEFKNMAEIDEWMSYLKELKGLSSKLKGNQADMLGDMDLNSMGLGQTLSPAISYTPDGTNCFIRKHPESAAAASGSEDADMEMMNSFFEGCTYTITYHLPGKVKRSTLPNAQKQGNTLVAEYPLLDIMQQKVNPSGKVQFKKK